MRSIFHDPEKSINRLPVIYTEPVKVNHAFLGGGMSGERNCKY